MAEPGPAGELDSPKPELSLKEGSVGKIDRREWEIFTQLREKSPYRLPAFGDYAVQHPQPPLDGGGPGMRANIRYTVKGQCWLPAARAW